MQSCMLVKQRPIAKGLHMNNYHHRLLTPTFLKAKHHFQLLYPQEDFKVQKGNMKCSLSLRGKGQKAGIQMLISCPHFMLPLSNLQAHCLISP